MQNIRALSYEQQMKYWGLSQYKITTTSRVFFIDCKDIKDAKATAKNCLISLNNTGVIQSLVSIEFIKKH